MARVEFHNNSILILSNLFNVINLLKNFLDYLFIMLRHNDIELDIELSGL